MATDDAVDGIRHLHPDHLGNTRVTTDAAGALVSAYFFHPYGEIAAALTPGEEVLLFTGHERDGHDLAGATGTTDDLDYMHARYYNPMVGRFLRVDPIFAPTGSPRGTNQYAYVLSNPMKLVDPFGLFPCPGLPGIECHDEITVVGFVDDANQDLEDLLTLVRLASTSGKLDGAQQVQVDLGIVDRAFSAVPIQGGVDFGRCVRDNRADPLAALSILGSAVPKRLVPPFRVPKSKDPLTNPSRVVGHQIKTRFPNSPTASRAAGTLRATGRVVSRVATPVTLVEGFFDIGVITFCAFED